MEHHVAGRAVSASSHPWNESGTSPIRVGLLGMGTVGQGVWDLLLKNGKQIAGRAGGPISIARALVRDPGKVRDVNIDASLLTTDVNAILNDPSIQVVVELIGCQYGLEPARGYMLEALARGKHVVTANKEVLAKCGAELFACAERHQAEIYFEAAVAGGIPIIKALKECLTANRIQKLIGIINGTTNYMLTRMTADGTDFETVLREAQEKGYAEADPTSDVEGYDAAYKLAILASIAFESEVPVDQVHCEGISRISAEDMAHASELGYVVKLLAVAKETDMGLEARVHPAMIPRNHPLAAVNDVFNAIFVRGDAVGDLMFYGRGAGRYPTASAVVADIIDAAQNLRRRVPGRLRPKLQTPRKVLPISATHSRYYVLTKVHDRPGVLAAIAKSFGEEGVSIESVLQKGRGEEPVSLVFVTHTVLEARIRAALEKISRLDCVHEVANVIRVEGE